MRHGIRLIVGGLVLLGLAGCAQPQGRVFVPSGRGVSEFQASPLASSDALGHALVSRPLASAQ